MKILFFIIYYNSKSILPENIVIDNADLIKILFNVIIFIK
jgi:hypothetical protein